jgi:flavin reductase (DIM6/NTAB) family NADH-FMN oxidoreductase RutF
LGVDIDSREFRQTVGQFVTGVTVVAMEVDGEIRTMTANAFTSVSLDPPLVLVCVGKRTRMGKFVESARGFSINILRLDQQQLSAYFAGLWHEPEPPPFQFLTWEGGPRLDGAAGAIGCERHAIYDGGDHWIVIGRVLALHRPSGPYRPLAFYRGRYVAVEESERLGDDSMMISWSEPIG